ncbi:MAG TPA: SRPBCC family protein [Candidatus Krumholzibacteria bacterium]|nr:SRPBCC family protein [Candidatus Krumholzibacteria bacterium]
MTATTMDRIERQIALKAPRKRVWQALTNSVEFGQWFGITLDGPFQAGKTVRGKHPVSGKGHILVEYTVEKIEPETLFSYRWHPYACEPERDYSTEPKTLVEFRLQDDNGGTLLTVTESGFDGIPADRRDEAFRKNTAGWEGQILKLQRYVEQ